MCDICDRARAHALKFARAAHDKDDATMDAVQAEVTALGPKYTDRFFHFAFMVAASIRTGDVTLEDFESSAAAREARRRDHLN